MGIRFKWQRAEDVDEAWTLITRQIDAGHPLRTPWLEEALITGYIDAEKKADRRVYLINSPFMWPG